MSILSRVRRELAALAPYHVPPLRAEVKLDANESPYPPDPALADALAEAVRSAPLHRYPDARAARLRALVAADLAQPEDRLVFGNGADELLALLCQTFAAPDERGRPACVVYPAPSFSVYRTAAAGAGLDVIEAPLGPRFAPDLDALLDAVTEHAPSIVFLATPNNPTGTRWPRPLVERLARHCPRSLLVIDEAYAAYGRESLLDLVLAHEHCVSLRTYSKLGLAGLRLGVLVAQPHVAHEVEKVRPPYNLGVLPQIAGELALGPFRASLGAHVDEVIAERERLRAALGRLPALEVFDSAANLLLVRAPDGPGLYRALAERSILVRDLHRPGPLANCLRVTVGTPRENDRLLAALGDLLA